MRARRPKIASSVSERPAPTRPPSPTISPRRSVERNVAHHRVAREVAAPRAPASPSRSTGATRSHRSAPSSRPTIRRTSSVWFRLRSAAARDRAPFAHHGDAVGDREDLLEPMRDEDERRGPARAARMTSNRRSTSRGLSEAVGSSKMMRSAVERERLGDLDKLALRGRKRADLGCRAGPSRVLTEDRQNSLARRRMRRTTACPGRPSSGRKMFSSTERSGARRRLLHHHGDAGVERLARPSDARGWPR